jgi:hypothetical protein
MSQFLKADEATKLKRGITQVLNNVHAGQRPKMPAPNENYLLRKGDCEKAIAAIHSGRTVRMAEATTGSNASEAIALMHRGPAEFSGRDIAGNRKLVEKLVLAVGQAVIKDFASKCDAKRELRKMIDG